MTTDTPLSMLPARAEATRPTLREWLQRTTTRDLGRAVLFASPALVIFGLFTYMPFFHAIWLSLHVTNNQGDAARWNGIDYYLRILGLDGSGRTEYVESIVRSFQFSLMVVPAVILISFGLALLATAKVRGIQFFRTVFTSTIAISLASGATIWSLLFNPSTNATTWLVKLLGVQTPSLLGTDWTALLAVAMMTVWSGIGFNFIITLAGLQAIPEDLYESAAIDGANRVQALRYITLPLLSPTLLFLLVINTIGSLQAFTQFHLLMPDRENTVFVYHTFRTFWYDTRYGLASALSLVLFVMLLALTAVQYGFLNRRVNYT